MGFYDPGQSKRRPSASAGSSKRQWNRQGNRQGFGTGRNASQDPFSTPPDDIAPAVDPFAEEINFISPQNRQTNRNFTRSRNTSSATPTDPFSSPDQHSFGNSTYDDPFADARARNQAQFFAQQSTNPIAPPDSTPFVANTSQHFQPPAFDPLTAPSNIVSKNEQFGFGVPSHPMLFDAPKEIIASNLTEEAVESGAIAFGNISRPPKYPFGRNMSNPRSPHQTKGFTSRSKATSSKDPFQSDAAENDPFAEQWEKGADRKSTRPSKLGGRGAADWDNGGDWDTADWETGDWDTGVWDTGSWDKSNATNFDGNDVKAEGKNKAFRANQVFIRSVPVSLFSKQAITEHFSRLPVTVGKVSLRGSKQSDSRRTAVVSFGSEEEASLAISKGRSYNRQSLHLSIFKPLSMRTKEKGESRRASDSPDNDMEAWEPASNERPANVSNELLFTFVPEKLASEKEIRDLFDNISNRAVLNVTLKERPYRDTVKRTSIITFRDVTSAGKALRNLPLYNRQKLNVSYRQAPSNNGFHPSKLETDTMTFEEYPQGTQIRRRKSTENPRESRPSIGYTVREMEDVTAEVADNADTVGFDEYSPSSQTRKRKVRENTRKSKHSKGERDKEMEVLRRGIAAMEEKKQQLMDRNKKRFFTQRSAHVSSAEDPDVAAESFPLKFAEIGSSSRPLNEDSFSNSRKSQESMKGDQWRQVGQKIDILDAKQFIGTCQGMCPPDEFEARLEQRDVSVFELSNGRGTDPDPKKAVKKYRRSAAISEAPKPGEVRPPPVLSRTMEHLKKVCDLTGFEFCEVHNFVRDRTRSIRQDFTLQGIRNGCCIKIHEESVRFHIVSEHRLYGTDPAKFSSKQNLEQLDKCLISLREMYNLRREMNMRTSPNEPEMQAYYMLTQMSDPQTCVQLWTGFAKDVHQSPAVRFAWEVVKAASDQFRNPVTYFLYVRRAPYLMACLMHSRFVAMRVRGLELLNATHGNMTGRDEVAISTLTSSLSFEDDEETIAFCELLGFDIVTSVNNGELKEAITTPCESFDADRVSLWKTKKATNIVESKAANLAPSEIINGSNDAIVFSDIPTKQKEVVEKKAGKAIKTTEELPVSSEKNSAVQTASPKSPIKLQNEPAKENNSTDAIAIPVSFMPSTPVQLAIPTEAGSQQPEQRLNDVPGGHTGKKTVGPIHNSLKPIYKPVSFLKSASSGRSPASLRIPTTILSPKFPEPAPLTAAQNVQSSVEVINRAEHFPEVKLVSKSAGLQSVFHLRSESPVLLKNPISKGNNVASNKLEKEASRLAERRKQIVAIAINARAARHKERCNNLKLEFENYINLVQKCFSEASNALDSMEQNTGNRSVSMRICNIGLENLRYASIMAQAAQKFLDESKLWPWEGFPFPSHPFPILSKCFVRGDRLWKEIDDCRLRLLHRGCESLEIERSNEHGFRGQFSQDRLQASIKALVSRIPVYALSEDVSVRNAGKEMDRVMFAMKECKGIQWQAVIFNREKNNNPSAAIVRAWLHKRIKGKSTENSKLIYCRNMQKEAYPCISVIAGEKLPPSASTIIIPIDGSADKARFHEQFNSLQTKLGDLHLRSKAIRSPPPFLILVCFNRSGPISEWLGKEAEKGCDAQWATSLMTERLARAVRIVLLKKETVLRGDEDALFTSALHESVTTLQTENKKSGSTFRTCTLGMRLAEVGNLAWMQTLDECHSQQDSNNGITRVVQSINQEWQGVANSLDEERMRWPLECTEHRKHLASVCEGIRQRLILPKFSETSDNGAKRYLYALSRKARIVAPNIMGTERSQVLVEFCFALGAIMSPLLSSILGELYVLRVPLSKIERNSILTRRIYRLNNLHARSIVNGKHEEARRNDMDRSEVSLRKRRRVERGSLMELSVPRARRAFSRKRFSLGEELKAYLGTPKRRFSMPWTYGRRKWDEVYNAILVETEEFQKDLDATLQLLQKRRRLNPNGNSVAHN